MLDENKGQFRTGAERGSSMVPPSEESNTAAFPNKESDPAVLTASTHNLLTRRGDVLSHSQRPERRLVIYGSGISEFSGETSASRLLVEFQRSRTCFIYSIRVIVRVS